MDLHHTKEASLQGELHDAQRQLSNAVEMCTGEFGCIILFPKTSVLNDKYDHFSDVSWPELDQQLKKARENDSLKGTEMQKKMEVLAKEKDKFLDLSMQRGKLIQVMHNIIFFLQNGSFNYTWKKLI